MSKLWNALAKSCDVQTWTRLNHRWVWLFRFIFLSYLIFSTFFKHQIAWHRAHKMFVFLLFLCVAFFVFSEHWNRKLNNIVVEREYGVWNMNRLHDVLCWNETLTRVSWIVFRLHLWMKRCSLSRSLSLLYLFSTVQQNVFAKHLRLHFM